MRARWIVVSVLVLVVLAGPVAAIHNGTPVSGTNVFKSPDGAKVTLTGSTSMNFNKTFPDNYTVHLVTTAGNATFTAPSRANVTIAAANITGSETSVSDVKAAGTTLEVNPEDKAMVNLTGAFNRVSWKSMSATDSAVDFSYNTGSSSSDITLFGLPANQAIAANDSSTGTTLAVGKTNANGVLQLQNLPSGTHDVVLRETSSMPSFSNPVPTGPLSSKPSELAVSVNSSLFPADSVTVNLSYEGSVVKTTTISSPTRVTYAISSPTGGSHSWSVTATNSLGSSSSASYSFDTPSKLHIYNESEPTKLVKNETVDLKFYFNETGSPSVYNRSTTTGVVNMSGLPTGTPFVVVASSTNYTSRRIFVPSLYDTQDIFLLPKSATTADTIFKISDYTGEYPQSDTVLEVQRALNGSYQTVLGDYFGATGQFPAKLAYNERHRLVLLNVKTGQRRVMGSYTPLTSQTQTVVVAPNGEVKQLGSPPQADVGPGLSQLPAENNTTLSFSLSSNNASVSEWNVSVNSSSGTVWSTTRTSEGTFYHNLSLAKYAGQDLHVLVTYRTANGTFVASKRTFHVLAKPASHVSLLGSIMDLVQLSPKSDRGMFESFLAMGITIFAIAGMSALGLSGDVVGVGGVLLLVAFASLAWVGWDLVFVAGVGMVAFSALRRRI